MIKLILVVAAIPVVLIGSIHLGVRVLRWAKKHRAEAAMGLSTGLLPDSISGAIDDWLDSSPSGGGWHSDSGGDHHDHSYDSGDGGDGD